MQTNPVEQMTVATSSTIAVVALFPEHWPLLLIAGGVAGLLRVFRVMRQRQPGFLWDALFAMGASMASAFFLWPVTENVFSPVFGALDVSDPISRIMFGAFLAGLSGTALVGAALDWRTPGKRDDKGGQRDA